MRLVGGPREPLLMSSAGAGASYDAAAAAYFAAMSVQLDATRKGYYDTFFTALRTAGLLAAGKFHWLHLYCAYQSTVADALINAINPGTYNGSAVGGLTWTTDFGFVGNGTTGYVDSNYNGSTQSLNQNSCHQGIYVRDNQTLISVNDIGAFVSSHGTYIQMHYHSSSDSLVTSACSDFTLNHASQPATGHAMWSRNASNSYDAYSPSTTFSGESTNSSVPPNGNNFVGAANVNGSASGFSTRSYFLAHMGSGWNSTEVAAFRSAASALKTSLGA